MLIRAVTVAVAAAFGASGVSKLGSVPSSLAIRDRLRVPTPMWRGIGIVELIGAAGLVVGLVRPQVGRAAAGGLALLMVGALGAHQRAGDRPQEWLAAAALGSATVALALGAQS